MIYRQDRNDQFEVRKQVSNAPTVSIPKRKKSVAQPRPRILVLPRGIGPVTTPNENDVLSGRGGRINAHPGNVQFRRHVIAKRETYLDKNTKKLEKAHIAALLVYNIRSLEPPGRFLKQDGDGSWWDIGDHKAIKKVGQAMREFSRAVQTDQCGEQLPDPTAEPQFQGTMQQQTKEIESHGSGATNQKHGFTTDVAINVPRHPPTVVDALQKLRQGNTPPSPEQISNYYSLSSKKIQAPVEVTGKSSEETVIAVPGKHGYASIPDQRPAAPFPERAHYRPHNISTSAISLDSGERAETDHAHVSTSDLPRPVAEQLFGRSLFPTKTGVSTLGSVLDNPDKVRLFQQAVSAALDAPNDAHQQSNTSNASSQRLLARDAIGKDNRTVSRQTEGTKFRSTATATCASDDNLLHRALSSTMDSTQAHQQKRTRVSEELFGRSLYTTQAGLSAIGSLIGKNNSNSEEGAIENGTYASPRDPYPKEEVGSSSSSSSSIEGHSPENVNKRKLVGR